MTFTFVFEITISVLPKQKKEASFLVAVFLTMVAIRGHCPFLKLVDREREFLEKLENR